MFEDLSPIEHFWDATSTKGISRVLQPIFLPSTLSSFHYFNLFITTTINRLLSLSSHSVRWWFLWCYNLCSYYVSDIDFLPVPSSTDILVGGFCTNYGNDLVHCLLSKKRYDVGLVTSVFSTKFIAEAGHRVILLLNVLDDKKISSYTSICTYLRRSSACFCLSFVWRLHDTN